MGQKVVVLEFGDPALQALQLAHVIPFTVTLDTPTDTDADGEEGEPKATAGSSKAQVKKAIKAEYKAKIKAVKAEVYVGEDAPSNEPVDADALGTPALEGDERFEGSTKAERAEAEKADKEAAKEEEAAK